MGIEPPPLTDEKVYRKPVTLYADEKTGAKYFYLQQESFPHRKIQKLNILYTSKAREQVRRQVSKDSTCSEILLKDIPIECWLDEEAVVEDSSLDYLTAESFRLSGSKIASIRMRMHNKQKMAAQKQLKDPRCELVELKVDVECRMMNR